MIGNLGRISGFGRQLPNLRFPDPATHWARQPLPSMSAAGSGRGIGGGGGFLALLAQHAAPGGGSPRPPKVPRGLK